MSCILSLEIDCTLDFGFIVKGDVAELLFNISDGFDFSRGAEVQADFVEQLSHVLG